MEVNYYITSEFEKYKKYAEEGIMELIELKFLNISKEEEQILKNLNINYQIYRNKTIKIQIQIIILKIILNRIIILELLITQIQQLSHLIEI